MRNDGHDRLLQYLFKFSCITTRAQVQGEMAVLNVEMVVGQTLWCTVKEW